MDQQNRNIVEKVISSRKAQRRIKRIIALMAVFVLLMTTDSLKLLADTMESDAALDAVNVIEAVDAEQLLFDESEPALVEEAAPEWVEDPDAEVVEAEYAEDGTIEDEAFEDVSVADDGADAADDEAVSLDDMVTLEGDGLAAEELADVSIDEVFAGDADSELFLDYEEPEDVLYAVSSDGAGFHAEVSGDTGVTLPAGTTLAAQWTENVQGRSGAVAQLCQALGVEGNAFPANMGAAFMDMALLNGGATIQPAGNVYVFIDFTEPLRIEGREPIFRVVTLVDGVARAIDDANFGVTLNGNEVTSVWFYTDLVGETALVWDVLPETEAEAVEEIPEADGAEPADGDEAEEAQIEEITETIEEATDEPEGEETQPADETETDENETAGETETDDEGEDETQPGDASEAEDETGVEAEDEGVKETETESEAEEEIEPAVEGGDETEENTEDETEENTEDETEENTEDETEDETEENTEDETGENTGDETEENTEDETGENTEDETGENTEDETGENTGDETEEETETEDNTEAETGDESEEAPAVTVTGYANGINVTVTGDVPAEAVPMANLLAGGEQYDAFIGAIEAMTDADTARHALAFDIALTYNNEETQPDGPADVSVAFDAPFAVSIEDELFRLVRFRDGAAEWVDVAELDIESGVLKGFAFTADALAPVAVVSGAEDVLYAEPAIDEPETDADEPEEDAGEEAAAEPLRLGIATVTTAEGEGLPADAQGHAEIIDGEDAIASVQAFLNGGRRAKKAAARAAMPESETRYTVLDIDVSNADAEGYRVDVTLPEAIEAHDFRLFHIHDDVEEIEVTLYDAEGNAVDPAATSAVTGFSFITASFSPFVLQYTVDITYEDDIRKITLAFDGFSAEDAGVDADSVIRLLNDGVSVNLGALLSEDAQGATRSLIVDGQPADGEIADYAAYEMTETSGGVSFANGCLRITGDGSVALTDGEDTLVVEVTGYTALLADVVEGAGVSIDVLEGAVPAGSTASYVEHTEDETAELVSAYLNTEDTSAEDEQEAAEEASGEAEPGQDALQATGYASFDVSILQPEGDLYTDQGSYQVTVQPELDIDGLVPEGAEVTNVRYAVYHIHDGEASEVPATVEDGAVTFATDSFSDFIIEYTVEYAFANDRFDLTLNFTGFNAAAANIDDAAVIAALDEGLSLDLAKLLETAEPAEEGETLQSRYQGLTLDVPTDDYQNIDFASLSQVSAEGGVSYADGRLTIVDDGAIELIDGTYTLRLTVIGYADIVWQIRTLVAEGVTIEVLEGNVPETAEAVYAAHTAEETAGLAEAYGIEGAGLAGFDVKILDGEEEYAEPGEYRVTVTPELDLAAQVPAGAEATDVHYVVYHIHDGEAAEVPAEVNEDGALVFTTDSFSDFVLSYTVDFHWEVDGETYEYELTGGGALSLRALVEALRVLDGEAEAAEPVEDAEAAEPAETEEAEPVDAEEAEPADAEVEAVAPDYDAFVANIADVTFSNEALLRPLPVVEDTTAGDLKALWNLAPEYSAELTEEQIAELDAQAFQAPDWALMSLKPFVTDETLTVTMKDGEAFAIRVTDAQIKKTVIDAKGDTWEITVTYGDDAQIPDGAELRVEEILPEDERYKEYYKNAFDIADGYRTEDNESGVDSLATDDSVQNEEAGSADADPAMANEVTVESVPEGEYARFFDISIWHEEEEVEPQANVSVSIKLMDAPLEDNSIPAVVHFAEDGPEMMELKEQTENNKEEGLRFNAKSFSVYGVVYTVDLFFEIDGKSIEVSIEGGNAFSFREAVEKLAVIEVDDVDSFIRNIKSIRFTNPDYLWIGNISDDMRLGELKESYNLDVVYSAELEQGNIDAMNNRHLYAPDWVLVSLKPFTSEETLTVETRSGEKFEVRVTDAQSDATLKPDGTVQTISNPSGTTIDLFDYWIADQYRYTAERDAWPGHYRYPNGPMYSNFYEFDRYDTDGNYKCDFGGWYYDQWGNRHYDNNKDGYLRGNGNNQGINQGHNFKFTPGVGGTVIDGTKNVMADDGNYGVNSWTKNATPRTGIVKGTLTNGYPVMTSNNNLGTDGTSLNYLFDGSSQTGKESYPGVNQLLYVDPDGYYTYDSNDFDAQFNAQSKTFTLTGQTAAVGGARGFWPFGNQVYWHGMHIQTIFSMPANGKVLNPKGQYRDMEFEFQGDDDTWLYVDGVLVGDGGGIHNQTLIHVNFREGSVLVSGEYDAKDEYKTDYHVVSYLDNLYTAAGKYNDYEWVEARDDNGNIIYHPNDSSDPRRGQPVMTFKSGTSHKFDMFYLERGGGESNLKIHYNLVSTTDFSAHKSYHMPANDPHARLLRNQFHFELIGFDDPNAGTGFEQAIMPVNGTATGAGTFESPKWTYHEATANSEGYTSLEIGVTEDGNVNFGNVQLQASQVGKSYRYMVREIVDPEAENADGVKWKNATDEQKEEGGFVNSDGITYDGRVYYFIGTVQETAPGSGVYELKKTRYTDSTYTTIDTETKFFSFVNGHVEPLTLKVLKKSDADSHRPLSGAQFSLVRARHDAGTDKWVPRTDATARTGTTTNGTLSFNNLTEGHYILEETAAPQGYLRNETYRWLLTLTKEDSADEIVLIPSLTPLDAQGNPTGAATVLEVGNDHVIEHEILNEKLPRGPLTVEKQWLRPDGETEYTAEEIAEFGSDVQGTQITGELWRRAAGDAVIPPTVKIYSKLKNENDYTLRWQEQVEPGGNVVFSMAVNDTGYPINQQYTTNTGDTVVPQPDQNITYDNGINKPAGHVYALQNIQHDVSIYGVFDSSKAGSQNPKIGFKLVSYTAPTGSAQSQPIDEKVADFTLSNANDWSQTWTGEQLNESDYDYEYYLKNVSEPALEGFTFVKDPEVTSEIATGAVTFAVKNVKEGEKTDLTVRKVWGDNINHSGDTISYKIQRTEYNAGGEAVGEAYDYIATGNTEATVYTLNASDAYNGVAWQKHHDGLPADNGKDENDPAYRTYKYSVVEVNVPSNYTVSYLTTTEENGGVPYDVAVMRNNPTDTRVSVEKKWTDPNGTELSEGIPEGVYITGTLKRSYTWQEASGATVRVYNRLWKNGQILSTTLYATYNDVQANSVFSLWAIDSNGHEPLNGVNANGNPVSQSGEAKPYDMGSWSTTTNAFVIPVNGETDVILDWAYNDGFKDGWHYDVDYTQASGGGESHEKIEDVGTFRLDATNGWKYIWTDRELDQDHVYTYFLENVQEHAANGDVVVHFDEFMPPEIGSLTQGSDGRWTATIVNRETTELSVTKQWVEDEADATDRVGAYTVDYKVQYLDTGSGTWVDFTRDSAVVTGHMAATYDADQDEWTITGNKVSDLPAGREYRAVETGATVTLRGSSTAIPAPVDDPATEEVETFKKGTTTANASGAFTTAFTNDVETVTVRIIKEWNHGSNNNLPASLKVTLSNGESRTLDASNEWTATISDLPKYNNDGTVIEYSWTEEELPAGYYLSDYEESSDPSTGVISATMTNSFSDHYNPLTTIHGKKIWNDDNNPNRPTSIKVQLYADGQLKETKTVQAPTGDGADPNQWPFEFTNLPVFNADGTVIQYTVEEVLPEGYTSVYGVNIEFAQATYVAGTASYTIVNPYEQDQMVSKGTDLGFVVIRHGNDFVVWTPRPLQDGELNTIKNTVVNASQQFNKITDPTRTITPISGVPQTVKVGNKEAVSVYMKEDEVWVKFLNPSAESDMVYGKIPYTYTQAGGEGGGTITNTRKVTEVTGTKTWFPAGTHNNAQDVTLTLTRTDGTTTQIAVKNESGETEWVTEAAEGAELLQPSWNEGTYTYEDLPKFTDETMKTEYTYSVVEVKFRVGETEYTVTKGEGDTFTVSPADRYKVTQTGNDIVNEELTQISVTKLWKQGENDKVFEVTKEIHFTLHYKYVKDPQDAENTTVTGEYKVDGQAVTGTVTYTPANPEPEPTPASWSVETIDGLPKRMLDEDGIWYDVTYFVVEDSIENVAITYLTQVQDAEATATAADAAVASGQITIINTDTVTNLTVQKTWTLNGTPLTADQLAQVESYEITYKVMESEDGEEWTYYVPEAPATNSYTLKWTAAVPATDDQEAQPESLTGNVVDNLPAGKRYKAVETGAKIKLKGFDEIVITIDDPSTEVVEAHEGTPTPESSNGPYTTTFENELPKTKIRIVKKWSLDGGEPQVDIPEWLAIDRDLELTVHVYRVNGVAAEIDKTTKVPPEEGTEAGPFTIVRTTDTEGNGKWELEIDGLDKYHWDGSKFTVYKYFANEDDSNLNSWHIMTYEGDEGGPKGPGAASDAWTIEDTITIVNSKYTVKLPSTGGAGTNALYATGAGLLILAAIWFIWDQRRRYTAGM